MPYALNPRSRQTQIEREREREREREGIIWFVEWSVPIIKPDGSIHICGHCKLTVNQASKLDNYLIPRTEDPLAMLGGGKAFTKLDTTQAYQQLLLKKADPELINRLTFYPGIPWKMNPPGM